MKKTTASGTILTFIIISVTLTINIGSVRATGTVYIRPDGSVEGTDKILQDGDIYTITDDIYDSLVIERDNIIVDGNGHRLQGTGLPWDEPPRSGIGLAETTNVTVQNTQIEGFYYGISLWGGYTSSSNNRLIENNITNSYMGISLGTSSNNNIIGNDLTDNLGGIDLWESANNNVSGNNLTATGVGVRINRSPGNSVRINIIANNDYGIMIFETFNNSISENNVTNNRWGMQLSETWNNNISRNNVTNNGDGIQLHNSWNNNITENNIEHNSCGVNMEYYTGPQTTSRTAFSDPGILNNRIYHNNFIDNSQQVSISFEESINAWDDGYPSGGNYWSDYTDIDLYNGPDQDLLGMDGIWDHPYVIDANNRDRYPLAKPWPIIPATVDADPDTLNLRSKGKWITVYIELPTRYDLSNVDVASIKLNDAFPADFSAPIQLGDDDLDGIPDLMIKFNRTQLESYIYDVLGIRYGKMTLEITGQLTDGTPFEGSDTIWVNYAGDVNNDGKIDVLDAAAVSAHWYRGPPRGPLGYDANADLNSDGLINILDSGIISSNWGQKTP